MTNTNRVCHYVWQIMYLLFSLTVTLPDLNRIKSVFDSFCKKTTLNLYFTFVSNGILVNSYLGRNAQYCQRSQQLSKETTIWPLFIDLFNSYTNFSESKIDLESENIITTETAVEKDSVPSTTSTSQYIMGTEDPISEQGASLSATKPTRYMMEIDDCLPEYCMDCPLWKPFSSRRFCWLKFRCRVRVLVEKKYFEWFILATVFLSSFALVRCTTHFEI